MKRSDYMEWAKTQSAAPFNLAASGVLSYPISELEITPGDIELTSTSGYGYPPLVRNIASRYGVTEDCVVTAMGTSFANHLAMATVLDRGDDVLIEHPAYDPLLSVANFLGANVRRFHRRTDGFRVDADELGHLVNARTRLIVMTNLHNPSSVLTEEPTLLQIRDIARSVGARVLVDEVYLELLSVCGRPARSAFHLGPEFIVTSSLTKAYGLSGLRCGWILAEPALATRMWRLLDLFYATAAHPAERLAVAAFRQLDGIARRAEALLRSNRALLDEFLDSQSGLETVRPPFGTVVFPRLKSGDSGNLCELLREKYQTSVVPGRFFEMPDHFRIGIGGDTTMVKKAIVLLRNALNESK